MPILNLPANPVPVYYAGGEGIRAYRAGSAPSGPASPEDWVGSTLDRPGGPPTAAGVPSGLSVVADGRSVRSLLADDPRTWLGSARSDGESGVLVKLLDPGERIPVHWHPDLDFARRHLGEVHGKAEAWVVLSESATVWLGFYEATAEDDLRAAIDRQDGDWMLARMHRFDLTRGATVFVPPGLVHAIEAGALLAEVQEPSRISLLAEYERFGADPTKATAGAGWDAALSCLLPPLGRDEVAAWVGSVPAGPGLTSPFPPDAGAFFWARVLEVDGVGSWGVDRLTIAIVDGGGGVLRSGPDRVVAPAGSTWLVAASTGTVEVEGTCRVVLFGPPDYRSW